jgi:hypothetical protein
MKKALLRLEDVGPGGFYESEESLWKLRVIADFLFSAGVPFHVAMIPRFVNPQTGYDKSIADRRDPYVKSFLETMRFLQKRGGSLGMHGYRHQYGQAVSGDGFEFASQGCASDCAPDDPVAAFLERDEFEKAYASERMRDGFRAVFLSGLEVDWFETPHYTASQNQRKVLEGWTGLFFENDPHSTKWRRVVIHDVDTPLYRGAVYVPTPLFYLDGANPEQDLRRMCKEIKSFAEGEVAGFFFHPYLEFPFIRREGNRAVYDGRSYLKRLVKCFQKQGFTFVPLLSLVSLVPSMRQTGFFPGSEVLVGDVNGDGRSELIVREEETGDWYVASVSLEMHPCRHHAPFAARLALKGLRGGCPLIGDVNGDGKDDLVLWNRETGVWQVALSDGVMFQPHGVWAKCLAKGSEWQPFLCDLNGDGRDEFALWNRLTGEWYAAVHRKVFAPAGYTPVDAVPRFGDVNGDGRDELVLWQPAAGTWLMGSYTGARFQIDAVPWLRGWAVGAEWQVLIGDFDGDGKEDVLVVNPARGDWQVSLSTGERLVPVESVLRPWAAGAQMEPLVGTWTRDGRAGVCARNRWLRGGTVDFAVSVIGKSKPGR